ncbi:cytochrome c oxidase subunit I (mitochondrion) [Trypanosoma rangeli SC58]|uniref:Cytochrome c oxidase subunit 1 n=2 Tax=Trypanosoma rangeli TaxID=5698 RepID=A0A088DKV0_TRYRA|nr:cytochrome c oxidase subunit I [Trypanosoma rangeli]ESL04766.1 cytochrome c oxidase subunit I [Trypanosoma rangeli SC58]
MIMFFICLVCLSVSHKTIGICYLLVAILCGFVGYVYSLFIRLEVSLIGCGVLFGDYQFYNVLVTAHGLIMVFAFIMPVVLGGLINYFAPVIVGFPDMVFPRLNNMSFWMFMGGFGCLVSGFLTEEGMGVGWTLYPTLICIDFHSSLACDFVIFSVHFLGISSILNSINFIGTIFCCRRKYFSFLVWTLFIWGTLVTSVLLLLTLPVLAGGVTLLLCDRNFNTSFYDVVGGGDLVLFQHLFWFFGHPEVYIIILPIFGLISTIIEVMGFRCVFSCVAMIYSMVLIAILGFFVWAHHMFVVGMDVDSRAYFGTVSVLIGLPTCIKLFNWMYSFLYTDLALSFEIYFVYMFVLMFLFGGVTGLFLSNVGLDILLHDTYFVIAHFHFVLSIAAVVGFFGGFFHFLMKWLPIELFLFWEFFFLWCLWFGVVLLFFPLHSLGMYAFPRRISDYPVSFLYWSSFSLFGMLIIASLVLFCCCLFSIFFFEIIACSLLICMFTVFFVFFTFMVGYLVLRCYTYLLLILHILC